MSDRRRRALGDHEVLTGSPGKLKGGPTPALLPKLRAASALLQGGYTEHGSGFTANTPCHKAGVQRVTANKAHSLRETESQSKSS